MQVLTHPAGRGLRWFPEGFALFARRPAQLTLLTLGYWLTMAVISAIPYAGQFIGLVLIPAFSVSLMNACRCIERQETLPAALLFSGFHRQLQTLLTLGALYVAAILAVLGVSALIDDGILFRFFVFGVRPTPEAIGDAAVISAATTICLLLPVIMAFWFSPVLAAWHDMSAGKAIFFSLVACLRNWKAFLAYLSVVLFAGLVLPNFLSTLPGFNGHIGAAVLTALILLVFLPAAYASFYVSYRDIFVLTDDDA